MGGPLATEIDHALRIIDFGRASAEIEAGLPDETRAWLEGFVAGINYYQDNVAELPAEFSILGLDREPWTVRDVLTCGRLAGTDVNWLVWFGALKLRKRANWPEIWARLVETGTASVPSFEGSTDLAVLGGLLAGIGKTGSNALAIAPGRSKTGAAIMASDPHLGISIPNLWLIAGLKSPGYHVVGLMAPALPIFAIGRNPWIAWGGTNMRAASSDLADLSGLPDSAIRTRTERISVRWWLYEDITIRETDWGPVLSDAPQLIKDAGSGFALRWVGHLPSDEITPMLRVSAARDFAEFKTAFETFAVPGQNMLYADNDGNIGQVMAVSAAQAQRRARGYRHRSRRQRYRLDRDGRRPRSAEHRQPRGRLSGLGQQPPGAMEGAGGLFLLARRRMIRMTEILNGRGLVSIDDVKAVQRDTYMTSSVTLRDLYLGLVKEQAIDIDGAERAEIVRTLRAWDGSYDADSRAAVAFEAFHNSFLPAFYETLLGADDAASYARFGRIRSLIVQDLARADRRALPALLEAAFDAATKAVWDYPTWGDMHRLVLRHPLSFVPLIGGRFEFGEFAAGGGVQTLMKTAHGAATGRHTVNYGSNARFVSDLGDLDRNYFTLLGGQDGWFNSQAFLDQVPLWREGRYIDVPLRIETIRARFPHKTRLGP